MFECHVMHFLYANILNLNCKIWVLYLWLYALSCMDDFYTIYESVTSYVV